MNAPAFHIRRARPSDGEAVRALVFETLEEYGIEPELDGHEAELMRFGEHDACVDEFVAEVDGRAVGCIMVAPRVATEHGGWLSKFFVIAACRGRGIGRALLATAVEAAKARGYHNLALDTRMFFEQAVHLYEATGWTRSEEPPASGPCEAMYTLDLTQGRHPVA